MTKISKYGIEKTSAKRSSDTLTFLQKTSQERISQRQKEQEESRKSPSEASSIFSGRNIASKLLAKKNKVLGELCETFDRAVITRIVRESLPFDLSHISDQELNEQIALVESTVFENVVKVHSKQHIMLPKKNFEGKNEIYLHLGLDDSQQPGVLVSKMSGAMAALKVQNHLKGNEREAGRMDAFNNLDTVDTRDIEFHKSMNTPIEDSEVEDGSLSEACMCVLDKLVYAVASKVKSKVGKDLLEDSRHNEYMETLTEGLDESAAAIAKQREMRKPTRISLLEELYKNNTTLQESLGANQEDYMNETVFQYTILEAYKVLNRVTKSDEEIASQLRLQRMHLTK